MPGEGRQQGELVGRQAHRSSFDPRLAPQQIDADIADAKHARRDGRPRPQISSDACQEFLESEWLWQVVVRAEIEPFNAVIHASPGAQHQDRNLGSPLPQALEHFEAVQVGQAEVQYHKRDAGAHDTLERVLAVLYPFNGVTVRAEPLLEERRDALFVLNDQKIHRGILTQNVAPCPGRLRTPDSPPWALASPRTME